MKGYKYIEKRNIKYIIYTTHGIIYIYPAKYFPNGYAWDGCSPKFNFLDLTIGTPDGKICENNLPITYYASLLHDYLYQYKKEINISRLDADKLFLQILKHNKFKLRYIYYYAVRMFGMFYGKWLTKKYKKSKLIRIQDGDNNDIYSIYNWIVCTNKINKKTN